MGRTTLTLDRLFRPLHSVYERYFVIPPHQEILVQDDFIKAVFFLEGGVELESEEGKRILIQEGDAYFTSGAGPLKYRGARATAETRVHALLIRFSRKHFEAPRRGEKETEEAQFLKALRRRFGKFHYFPAAIWGNHVLRLHEILENLGRTDHAARWKVSGLCFSLVSDYLDESLKGSGRKTEVFEGVAAVRHVQQFMQEHFREPLTLSEIAWAVRLSPGYLAALFRRSTGETVFSRLDAIRVEEGRRLLIVSDWPINQIAMKCGYSSANLFCRHFRKRVGQTPREFRIEGRRHESHSPSKFAARAY